MITIDCSYTREQSGGILAGYSSKGPRQPKVYRLELAANLREDFTITEIVGILLVAVTLRNALRQYATYHVHEPV